MTDIILATRNIHKARELKTLLRGLDVNVRTLDDVSDHIILKEDGDTFEAKCVPKSQDRP